MGISQGVSEVVVDMGREGAERLVIPVEAVDVNHKQGATRGGAGVVTKGRRPQGLGGGTARIGCKA